jgi:hypothetical protein
VGPHSLGLRRITRARSHTAPRCGVPVYRRRTTSKTRLLRSNWHSPTCGSRTCPPRLRDGPGAAKLEDFRAGLKPSRKHLAGLLQELPGRIREIASWDGVPADARDEPLATLTALHEAAVAAQPHIVPSRAPGGQSRPWPDLAGWLADHLELVLQERGTRASYKADGPLVRFLAPLLSAVFGEEFTNDAVEQTLKRRARQRRQ